MEALVTDGLLRHPDIDVKVSIASCISEIMRISAPDQPYDDTRLKEFFGLAVMAFGKLSCLDGHCYSKVVSIIEVLAKCRTCVLMLDLQLDGLIVQMFQHFLKSIREKVINLGIDHQYHRCVSKKLKKGIASIKEVL